MLRGIAPVSASTHDAPYVPTIEELFDWAERTYPTYFPPSKTTKQFQDYAYRHYPETGNYVGVKSRSVYILGPVVGQASEPIYVAQVADFACQVNPSSCIDGKPPGSRYGIRPARTGSPFYDRYTGAVFTPRGFNYVRLARQPKFFGGEEIAHSTFNVGLYDPISAESALRSMASMGYNVVRVFLSVCCEGTLSTRELKLSEPYLRNLADFVSRAKLHGVGVVVTSDGWLPSGYPRSAQDSAYELINMVFLSDAGVQGNKEFWTDFVGGLRRAGAPLDNVLAYSVANEAFADLTAAPFTRTAGNITPANGRTYDLGNSATLRTLVDESLLYFGNEVGAAIRATDPTALVTMGILARNEPHLFTPGETRLAPKIFPSFNDSTLDFIDLHPYPVFGITFEQQMENYGLFGRSPIPLVMGEFGDLRQRSIGAPAAIASLRDWPRQSCQFGFVGWILWTWDTTEIGGSEWWTGAEAGAAIAQALSPQSLSNPCTP